MLICGDQVIGFKDTIREKPESEEQAKAHLQSYGDSGEPCVAYSCIEVTNLKSGKRNMKVDVAKAYFKSIPDDVALRVIEKKVILSCAGSLVVTKYLLS